MSILSVDRFISSKKKWCPIKIADVKLLNLGMVFFVKMNLLFFFSFVGRTRVIACSNTITKYMASQITQIKLFEACRDWKRPETGSGPCFKKREGRAIHI